MDKEAQVKFWSILKPRHATTSIKIPIMDFQNNKDLDQWTKWTMSYCTAKRVLKKSFSSEKMAVHIYNTLLSLTGAPVIVALMAQRQGSADLSLRSRVARIIRPLELSCGTSTYTVCSLIARVIYALISLDQVSHVKEPWIKDLLKACEQEDHSASNRMLGAAAPVYQVPATSAAFLRFFHPLGDTKWAASFQIMMRPDQMNQHDINHMTLKGELKMASSVCEAYCTESPNVFVGNLLVIRGLPYLLKIARKDSSYATLSDEDRLFAMINIVSDKATDERVQNLPFPYRMVHALRRFLRTQVESLGSVAKYHFHFAVGLAFIWLYFPSEKVQLYLNVARDGSTLLDQASDDAAIMLGGIFASLTFNYMNHFQFIYCFYKGPSAFADFYRQVGDAFGVDCPKDYHDLVMEWSTYVEWFIVAYIASSALIWIRTQIVRAAQYALPSLVSWLDRSMIRSVHADDWFQAENQGGDPDQVDSGRPDPANLPGADGVRLGDGGGGGDDPLPARPLPGPGASTVANPSKPLPGAIVVKSDTAFAMLTANPQMTSGMWTFNGCNVMINDFNINRRDLDKPESGYSPIAHIKKACGNENMVDENIPLIRNIPERRTPMSTKVGRALAEDEHRFARDVLCPNMEQYNECPPVLPLDSLALEGAQTLIQWMMDCPYFNPDVDVVYPPFTEYLRRHVTTMHETGGADELEKNIREFFSLGLTYEIIAPAANSPDAAKVVVLRLRKNPRLIEVTKRVTLGLRCIKEHDPSMKYGDILNLWSFLNYFPMDWYRATTSGEDGKYKDAKDKIFNHVSLTIGTQRTGWRTAMEKLLAEWFEECKKTDRHPMGLLKIDRWLEILRPALEKRWESETVTTKKLLELGNDAKAVVASCKSPDHAFATLLPGDPSGSKMAPTTWFKSGKSGNASAGTRTD